MCYLAIEKNGDEYIFQHEPKRLENCWCSFEINAIKLPKKTILKLTGRIINWSDDPIKLETEKINDFYILVCSLSGCDINSLSIRTRKKETVQARQIIMAHRKIYLGLSLSEAGFEFGKDHATVLHSIKTIQDLHQTSKSYREQFKELFTEYPLLLTYKIGASDN